MAAEVKKEVSFDVFGQLDFRVGTILLKSGRCREIYKVNEVNS